MTLSGDNDGSVKAEFALRITLEWISTVESDSLRSTAMFMRRRFPCDRHDQLIRQIFEFGMLVRLPLVLTSVMSL